MPIAIATPDKLLMSCLNLLRLPELCSGELPLQSSGRFDLSDIYAFSFDKIGGVTTALDKNEYGTIIRLQNRTNLEITTRLQSCMAEQNIHFGTLQHNAMPAAVARMSVSAATPIGATRKGIRLERRYNCNGGSSGTERLQINEIRIYPTATYNNVTLYIETNGILASVILPQLIGNIENIFSTTSSNPLFRLAEPFISESGYIAFYLDASIGVATSRPVCPTCSSSPQCFKAYGAYDTNAGATYTDSEAFGIVPYASCYCDPNAFICAISHTPQFQAYWLAAFSLAIYEETILSDVFSNITVYSSTAGAEKAGELLNEKKNVAEAVLCDALTNLIRNNQDRCLVCRGSQIATMI